MMTWAYNLTTVKRYKIKANDVNKANCENTESTNNYVFLNP